MKRVLFLCTGNSCRSQMAEGWARHFGRLEPYSAGIETHGLNRHAVAVMREAGVDISGQRSQHVRELAEVELDLLVTVCDHAAESCPAFPSRVPKLHASFPDPPRLAAGETDPERALDHYRRVRDEIRAFVERLPDHLEAPSAGGSP